MQRLQFANPDTSRRLQKATHCPYLLLKQGYSRVGMLPAQLPTGRQKRLLIFFENNFEKFS